MKSSKKDFITIVGMDVHKNSISIALASTDGTNEIRSYGRIGGTMTALDMFIRTLVSRGIRPRFVYEAGPCGFAVYRHLTKQGYSCKVAAPSLIPKKPGDKVKNDKRDAITLAKLERSGDLTEVIVPSEEIEAIRDLTRARQDAVRAQTAARHQLKSFLLRHDKRSPGSANWGISHMKWIKMVTMDDPILQTVLEHYIETVMACGERVKHLNEKIARSIPGSKIEPAVLALKSMRGIDLVTAATIAAETGDMGRFPTSRAYMSFIGIMPSEHSSGDSIRRGKITKTGNIHLRFILIEAARHYAHKAAITRTIQERQEGVPKAILDCAWKAQKRLCRRFLTLLVRGKHKNVIAVAIARELAAFVWAITRKVQMAA